VAAFFSALTSPLRFRLPRAKFMIAHKIFVPRQVEEEGRRRQAGEMQREGTLMCSCESSSGGGNLMIAVGISNDTLQLACIRIIC
jgi:hypothetical protein